MEADGHSHFAVLGAIAIVLALGFEPFIQNLVHYSASLVEDGLQPSILANSSYYDSVGSPSAFAVGGSYPLDSPFPTPSPHREDTDMNSLLH